MALNNNYIPIDVFKEAESSTGAALVCEVEVSGLLSDYGAIRFNAKQRPCT